MAIAQSTHRRDSLVHRRPVERAGADTDRAAQKRPGAGFLPPRLPVARRVRAGYRIYSVDDFFHGLDCEALEQYPAEHPTQACLPAPVGSTRAGRRIVCWALLGGTVATVVAILWSAVALRSIRPGARASLRSVPFTAGSNRREPTSQRVDVR